MSMHVKVCMSKIMHMLITVGMYVQMYTAYANCGTLISDNDVLVNTTFKKHF